MQIRFERVIHAKTRYSQGLTDLWPISASGSSVAHQDNDEKDEKGRKDDLRGEGEEAPTSTRLHPRAARLSLKTDSLFCSWHLSQATFEGKMENGNFFVYDKRRFFFFAALFQNNYRAQWMRMKKLFAFFRATVRRKKAADNFHSEIELPRPISCGPLRSYIY